MAGCVTVEIECHVAEGLHLPHSYKAEKYPEYVKRLEDALQDELGDQGISSDVVTNPKQKGMSRVDGMQNWYWQKSDSAPTKVRYPRAGAFEVTVRTPADFAPASSGLPEQLEVWSKLRTQKWPDPERLAAVVARVLVRGRDSEDVSETVRRIRRQCEGPARAEPDKKRPTSQALALRPASNAAMSRGSSRNGTATGMRRTAPVQQKPSPALKASGAASTARPATSPAGASRSPPKELAGRPPAEAAAAPPPPAAQEDPAVVAGPPPAAAQVSNPDYPVSVMPPVAEPPAPEQPAAEEHPPAQQPPAQEQQHEPAPTTAAAHLQVPGVPPAGAGQEDNGDDLGEGAEASDVEQMEQASRLIAGGAGGEEDDYPDDFEDTLRDTQPLQQEAEAPSPPPAAEVPAAQPAAAAPPTASSPAPSPSQDADDYDDEFEATTPTPTPKAQPFPAEPANESVARRGEPFPAEPTNESVARRGEDDYDDADFEPTTPAGANASALREDDAQASRPGPAEDKSALREYDDAEDFEAESDDDDEDDEDEEDDENDRTGFSANPKEFTSTDSIDLVRGEDDEANRSTAPRNPGLDASAGTALDYEEDEFENDSVNDDEDDCLS